MKLLQIQTSILFNFIVILIFLVEIVNSINLFDILDNELLKIHGYNAKSLSNDLEVSDNIIHLSTQNLPFLICIQENIATKQDFSLYDQLIKQHQCEFESKPIYFDKLTSITCHLIYSPAYEIILRFLEFSSSSVKVYNIESDLKVDTSIINFFDNSFSFHNDLNEFTKLSTHDFKTGKFQLSIEYSPCSKDIYKYIHNVIDKFEYKFDKIIFDVDNKLQKISKWYDILKSSLNNTQVILCNNVISNLPKHYNLYSVDLIDIHTLPSICTIQLIYELSMKPDILKLSIHSAPTVLNHDAKNIIQGGKEFNHPYSNYQLTGKGQICGVADSGLYDLSCFFYDDSNQYSTKITDRSGTLEPDRRKVIQYVSFADSFDEIGGHGTHVCGSIVGSSQSNLTNMNGMAPDAKITFFDIGTTGHDYLLLPPLHVILDTAYNAGARIHSNSWGNNGGIYGAMSYDLDKYLYDHDDVLVLFAAGNEGAGGLMTINSPGNAKNCIAVGASQVREVLNDALYMRNNERVIASFSSMGPTYDGRIKPDIISPGDFIMSAFAGDFENTISAQMNETIGKENCASHQMSGTSMATPVTAGISLLIRQFFMDSSFWESLCNPRYSQCQGGSFIPSGYLIKTMLIHSGEAMTRYSESIYDGEPTFFRSFGMYKPPDVFQGFGEVYLKNILPLPNNEGLEETLDLIVFDKLELFSDETIGFDIDLLPYVLEQINDISFNLDNLVIPPIKISICWFDPPSSIGYVRKLLIHDIDIVLTDPLGFHHWGNFPEYQPMDDLTKDAIISVNTTEYEAIKERLNIPIDLSQSDDKNTVERIHIEKPICVSPIDLDNMRNNDEKISKLECVYKLRVHANKLTYSPTQKIALVITTAGVVSNQYNSNDTWVIISDSHKTGDEIDIIESNNITFKISVNSELSGIQNKSISQFSPITGFVEYVKVSLDFIPEYIPVNQRIDAICPASLELTLIDPYGNSISIGGADESLGKANLNTEWPDEWYSSSPGSYHAVVNTAIANLNGYGYWSIYLFNSWSLSPKVYYDATIELVYVNDSSYVHSKYYKHYNRPDQSKVDYTDSTIIYESKKEYVDIQVDIPLTGLGVKAIRSDVEDTIQLVQDRVLLHKFHYSGILQSISLHLDGYEIIDNNIYFTRGSNSWLLAVVVKDPQGFVAQVGGYNWFAQESNFISRRWPDPWIGKLSMSKPWVSTRDISDAKLSYLPAKKHPDLSDNNDKNDDKYWTVEIAQGYVFGPRIPTNYSGFITLSFIPQSNLDSYDNDLIPSFYPTIYPTNQTVISNDYSYGYIIEKLLKYLYIQVIITLILILIIYCIIQTLRNRKSHNKFRISSYVNENTQLLNDSNRRSIQLVEVNNTTRIHSNRNDYINLPTSEYGSIPVKVDNY